MTEMTEREKIKDIIIQSVSGLPSALSLSDISQLGDAAQLQYGIANHVLNDVFHACPEIQEHEDYEQYSDEFYDLVGQDAENAWSSACKMGKEMSSFPEEINSSFGIAFSEILEDLKIK